MEKYPKNSKKRIRVFPVILLFFTLIIALLLIDSNLRIVTTEYELYFSNLPVTFDGFRIVVLADIHDTEFGRDNEKLISRVRDANPDIIAIAGDLLNAYSNHRPIGEQLERVESLIIGLTPIAPVYFVTGNHDLNRKFDAPVELYGGPVAFFELLDELDVRVLRNEYEVIESGGEIIIIAGVNTHSSDYIERIESELADKIYSAEGDEFIVLLRHKNDHMHFLSEHGFDLILSGHAHGGVIRLPFTDGLIGPDRDFFPTFTNGVYSAGDTYMLVSRGIGNATGIPRFLNNPHVAVAVLRSA